MFEKKKCRNCGAGIKDSWQFCSNCGTELKKKIETPFRGVFKDVEKELEKMNKTFGFGFPKVGFRTSRDGVSIIITSGTEEPVKIKTSGEHKKLEPEIKRRFGGRPGEEREAVRVPKVTEEPETKIERYGNRQVIIMKLPGVKSREDVEVKRLEQSIEIKAFAGDKAYFKLIPVPHNALINKEFDRDILKIEVQR